MLVEWLGPDRLLHNTEFRVGMLMLGPSTVYPEHHHPAEEVYHVISGHALWSRAGAPWRLEPPGTMIHHAPNVPHATQTRDAPLLALYCWTGAIQTAARLTTVASVCND